MLFWNFNSKTVKELRMKQGLTVQQLALMVKISSSVIKKVDHFQMKNVPEPVKSRITPALKGK
jgi:ribosome-binding protein aMBF1 (putative translation factor)